MKAGGYIKFAAVFTLLWVVALCLYFGVAPHLFIRMFPHELGELLAGWFAPLAAVWVGAAVILQKEQLAAQKIELEHASGALKLQADESRRSVEQLERNALIIRLERLLERLMFGIQRFTRTAEGREIHSPSRWEQSAQITSVLGGHRKYIDLFRSSEVERALKEFGEGLSLLIERIGEGWVVEVTVDVVEDFCTELSSLCRIVGEVERLAVSIEDRELHGIPDGPALQVFRECAMHANKVFDEVLRNYETLDRP